MARFERIGACFPSNMSGENTREKQKRTPFSLFFFLVSPSFPASRRKLRHFPLSQPPRTPFVLVRKPAASPFKFCILPHFRCILGNSPIDPRTHFGGNCEYFRITLTRILRGNVRCSAKLAREVGKMAEGGWSVKLWLADPRNGEVSNFYGKLINGRIDTVSRLSMSVRK